MNRRLFIAATCAATLATLAGCKADPPPGEEFVGYWQGQPQGKRPPDLILIERNGKAGFLLTITAFDGLFGGGYKSRSAHAVISGSTDMLVVTPTMGLAYDKATDELVSGKLRATRITQSQYQTVLSSK